jgi:hypothetical protein
MIPERGKGPEKMKESQREERNHPGSQRAGRTLEKRKCNKERNDCHGEKRKPVRRYEKPERKPDRRKD